MTVSSLFSIDSAHLSRSLEAKAECCRLSSESCCGQVCFALADATRTKGLTSDSSTSCFKTGEKGFSGCRELRSQYRAGVVRGDACPV